jgi:hypothetical protein
MSPIMNVASVSEASSSLSCPFAIAAATRVLSRRSMNASRWASVAITNKGVARIEPGRENVATVSNSEPFSS